MNKASKRGHGTCEFAIHRRVYFALVAAVGLGACTFGADVMPLRPALSDSPVIGNAAAGFIKSNHGQNLGSVQLKRWPRSVAIGIVASKMAPGEYRLWLHNSGRCDPPSFTSSGDNWRPAIGRYGNRDLSDVGPLSVAQDGRVSISTLVTGAKLRPGDEGADLPVMLDSDGISLHFVPEPGTSPLARTACAAIER